jgi:crotonobetainyl-CoA:carnitine CoA-transferase CaiB-like acyl-CoA transferase
MIPASVRAPAPEVGQHTEETLLEMGYTWEDITELQEKGVIIQ